MKVLIAAVSAGVLLSTGCSTPAGPGAPEAVSSESSPSPSTPPVLEVRVTRAQTDPRVPAACKPQQIGETVVAFMQSLNAGTVDLAAHFGTDTEWYSITEWDPRRGKRHFVASDLERLGGYFDKRIEQGESMHLAEIDVSYEPARDLGHVAYSLLRYADDLDPGRPVVIGKGAIECDTGKIVVWSMSHDSRLRKMPQLCPGEAEPPTYALACVRA